MRAASKIVSVATTTQAVLSVPVASPLGLWHLLSLDAPTVAVLWTCFIARAGHIHLPLAAPAAMGLAVWMLYAGDRLLDTRGLSDGHPVAGRELEARHLFHHRHRRAFCTGIVAAAVALAALLPRLNPTAMRLYLIEGALLAVWFLAVHVTRGAHRLPKEIAVGLFFSAAVFIPTVARQAAARQGSPGLTWLPLAILFAGLCSLNCVFIYAWEHEDFVSDAHSPHISTRLALAHLPALATGIAVVGFALTLSSLGPLRVIPGACAMAAILLLVLHRNHRRFAAVTLRATADLALLTPALLLPFLR